jgi:hypothetical protein
MRASRVAIRPDIYLNVYRRPTLSASGAGLPRSVGCPTTLFYMLYQSQSDENIKYRRSPHGRAHPLHLSPRQKDPSG